jgi:hypothetical protein
MSILNCGICGHPGVHATIIPEGATPTRCPEQCAICRREVAEEAAAQDDEGPART